MIPAVMILAAVYIVGVGHGVWMGWTHEARCYRWAGKANALQRRLIEAEERGKAA